MPTDQVRARIYENRVTFEAMIDEASLAVAQSRFRSAAVALQTAARFAWYNHPGVFQSPRLEVLTAQIGQHLPRPKSTTNELHGHVVHVISQAYSAGGHTRLVWRWIENDHTRVSSVVLTGQQGVPVPQPLQAAVAASGGKIISLGERSSNLLVRAAALRQIAQNGADMVVLHVHPYDVLPSIALNDVAAKVIFLNHADHVFSVGVGTADVVADIRPAGQRLSLARRNVPPHRSAILPVPLSAPVRGDKDLARKRLGISPDSCVIISIASGYKYGATPGNHFIDIHRDFVLAHPEVTLIVVGPESKDRWQEVSEETSGRFRAVGMAQGIDAYYDSADIYVDSIPFASLTSLLDAAIRGVSVLALSENVADSVLTSNDLSLVDKGVQFSNRNEYIRALEALVTSSDDRRLSAEAIQNAVARDHISPGWNDHLDHVVRMISATPAESLGAPAQSYTPAEEFHDLEVALVDFQAASGLSEPLWASRLRDAPYMPVLERVRLFAATTSRQRLRSLKFMIPDAPRSRIKVWLAPLTKR